MKAQIQQPKVTEIIQSKAAKQAPISTILAEYSNAIEHKVTEEKTIQRKFNDVVQRDAFWPIDVNDKVITNTPTDKAPNGKFIKRIGSSINHRLYNRSEEAKNAARKTTDWGDNGLSTRTPTNPPAGAGYYQYNKRTSKDGEKYNIDADTPMIVRHDKDPDAQLYSSTAPNVAKKQVRHWHAATSNAVDIKAPESSAEQPLYKTIDIEHFYVNPLL